MNRLCLVSPLISLFSGWSLLSSSISFSRKLTPIHPLCPRPGIHHTQSILMEKRLPRNPNCLELPGEHLSYCIHHTVLRRSVCVSVFPIGMCCRDCVLLLSHWCQHLAHQEHCLSVNSDDGVTSTLRGQQ